MILKENFKRVIETLNELPIDADVKNKVAELYNIVSERPPLTVRYALSAEFSPSMPNERYTALDVLLSLILLAERLLRKVQDWNAILDYLHVDVKQRQRYMNKLYELMKLISAGINVKFLPLTWREYAEFLSKKLNLSEGERKKILEVGEIVYNAAKFKSPSGIAAASAYIALKGKVYEKDLAKLLIITEVTIRNILREVRRKQLIQF